MTQSSTLLVGSYQAQHHTLKQRDTEPMEHVITNMLFLLEEARINGSSIGSEGENTLIAIREGMLTPSIGNYSPRNFRENSSQCYLLVIKTPERTIDGYIYYSDWVIEYGENWEGDSCYWDADTLERLLGNDPEAEADDESQ